MDIDILVRLDLQGIGGLGVYHGASFVYKFTICNTIL
jgi:hypothetical protein